MMKKLIAMTLGLLSAATAFSDNGADATAYRMVVPIAGIEQGSTPSEEIEAPDVPIGDEMTGSTCGDSYCYALVDGELYSVGVNNHGQLGLGDTIDRAEWTSTGLTGVSQFVAGRSSGYAIVNGELFVTGSNAYGQLGFDSSVDIVSAWQSTGLTGVTHVSSDHYYNAGAVVNGELFVTGNNRFYALGVDAAYQYGWVSTGLTGVSKSAIGYAASLAIVDGELWTIGYANRLSGSGGNRNYWEATGITGVTDIDTSVYSSLMIADGELWIFGYNYNGELGVDGPVNPYTNTGITGITDIELSSKTAYYIKSGDVYSSGVGNYGQLADGTTEKRSSFEPTGLTGATALATDYGGIVIAKTASGDMIAGKTSSRIPGFNSYTMTWIPFTINP